MKDAAIARGDTISALAKPRSLDRTTRSMARQPDHTTELRISRDMSVLNVRNKARRLRMTVLGIDTDVDRSQ
jgi:hypothetical protein